MLTKEELEKIGIGTDLSVPISRPDWDEYFLSMCELVAARSPDSNTKFGTIAVRDKRIVAAGYNGFVSGCEDNLMPNSRDPTLKKISHILHSEENMIYYAARNGIALEGCKVYIQGHACSNCCKKLISVGILDWVIGNRTYQCNDEEILMRRFYTEHFGVRIKVINKY